MKAIVHIEFGPREVLHLQEVEKPASLILPQPVNRWTNIIIAGFFFLFNLVGLPTYPSSFDKFLIVVELGFNILTVWYAWNWVGA